MVENIQIIGNRAIDSLPGQSMDEPHFAVMLRFSVALAVPCERPNKAGVSVRNAMQHIKEKMIGSKRLSRLPSLRSVKAFTVTVNRATTIYFGCSTQEL